MSRTDDGKLVCSHNKGPMTHVNGTEVQESCEEAWEKDNAGYIDRLRFPRKSNHTCEAPNLTQYQIKNAVFKICGYFMSKPLEDDESAFNRAKMDTIAQLKKDLADVEGITFHQFQDADK